MTEGKMLRLIGIWFGVLIIIMWVALIYTIEIYQMMLVWLLVVCFFGREYIIDIMTNKKRDKIVDLKNHIWKLYEKSPESEIDAQSYFLGKHDGLSIADLVMLTEYDNLDDERWNEYFWNLEGEVEE